jgi:hypothetical protein
MEVTLLLLLEELLVLEVVGTFGVYIVMVKSDLSTIGIVDGFN